ncbi:HAD-IA family hydrolase, partial [Catenulispora sp. NF23]|nr:HAD-IA family hydrolase [Catenulispora pinistramenti]
VEAVLCDLDDTLYPQAAWLEGAWRAVAAAGARRGIDEAAFLDALRAEAALGSARGGIIDRALAAVGAAGLGPPAVGAAGLSSLLNPAPSQPANTTMQNSDARAPTGTTRSTADATHEPADPARGTTNTPRGTADAPRDPADPARSTADATHEPADPARDTADPARGTADTPHGTADAPRNLADPAHGTADAPRADPARSTADATRSTADAARSTAPELVAHLVGVFRAHQPERLEPYPGVRAALARLRVAGVRLAVVTDGDVEMQAWKVRALGLSAFFECVVVSDALGGRGVRKPHQAPFVAALEGLGVGPARCVVVGDRPDKDVMGAMGLDIRAIRVKTGEYGLVGDVPGT